MASLDNLPADQRAVLQLILQRGRTYGQIATLLSIDRSAVRERALRAFDALGPQTGVPEDRRAVIADYLLGQLEPETAAQARDGIAATPSERAWARVAASELAPLAGEQLPEIPAAPSSPAPPADGAPGPSPPPAPALQPPPDGSPTPPESTMPVSGAEASAAGAAGAAEGEPRRSGRRPRRERKPKEPTASEPKVPAVGKGAERRSSRLGGTVLIALIVVIVAAVAILLLNPGGSSNPKPSAASTPAPAASSTTAASGSASSSASGSTTTPPRVIAQINLTPAAAGSKAAGIAEVLKEGANNGIAIVAQNVTPNTTRPPDAYAVWLYNSATDAHLLGFVNPGVGANGRLSTAGALPTNAAHYKQLIVTLETKASPTAPGKIIVQGTLTGHL